jgi:hypothetical protein
VYSLLGDRLTGVAVFVNESQPRPVPCAEQVREEGGYPAGTLPRRGKSCAHARRLESRHCRLKARSTVPFIEMGREPPVLAYLWHRGQDNKVTVHISFRRASYWRYRR